MDAEELAIAIGESVNSGINAQEFQDGLRREHNALQRLAYAEVLKPGIVALAGAEMVDPRNRPAVEQCREIADKMGWKY